MPFANALKTPSMYRLSRIWREEGVLGLADRAVRRLGMPRSLIYAVWRQRQMLGPVPKSRAIGARHIVLIDDGTRLDADAMSWFGRALEHRPDLLLAFGDHDHDWHGLRVDPWFKPAFDPVLLAGLDIVGGAALVAREILDGAGANPNGSLDRLARDLPEDRIVHIPRILSTLPWSRRALPHPASPPDPPVWPKVSVLIPTRDKGDLLRRCLDALYRTDYPDLEIILIDHETREMEARTVIDAARVRGARLIAVEGAFNYADFNNRAAAEAQGDFLLLLNNDVEAREPSWLKAMMRQGAKPSTGVVGARLLYPDGKLQHGGVIAGIGGVANHAQLGLKPGQRDYMHLTQVARQVSAVTAACLLTPRRLFHEVGGFDAARLAVAFNDVDYCLKLRSRGFKVIYEPQATLIHYESATRGLDVAPDKRRRFEAEIAAMRKLWGPTLDRDPFYHPALSLNGTDYCPAWQPRWEDPWVAGATNE